MKIRSELGRDEDGKGGAGDARRAYIFKSVGTGESADFAYCRGEHIELSLNTSRRNLGRHKSNIIRRSKQSVDGYIR